ncbi:MAG: NEW3 domain-containing protein, partial [Aigarchaeota archaeon]|nr:NEW3 domain-containing protein [Aigarchaeota archaeon]
GKGYFRLALPAGKYTIYFEKEGYATNKKDITVPAGYYVEPENDPVKMGEIVLQNALRISASVLSRVASPGSTVNFQFTLSNIGDKSEEIQFSVVAPAGWGTKILSAAGEVKKVLLESGSMSLELEVTVPSTFDEIVTVLLTALGTKNATLDFTVYPKTSITQEIKLKSTYLSVSEEIGRSIYFPLTITNNGEVDEIVDLLGVVPSDWSISFVTGSNMVVQSLYLASGQSESLTIKVVPSKAAVVGDYLVVVNVVSEDQILWDSLDLRVNLREATSDVEIISTFTDVTVEAGANINFRITIWNKGETDALFLLTVLSVPQNWKTVFTSDDIEISSALVTAGESLTLQLEVTPPRTVETGEYPIIVYTESDDGLITKQIDLKVNVVGSYEMDLELSTLYKTLTIGESVEFTAKVTNQGNSPITTIYLDTVVPEDWETTTTPAQVSTLAPRESVTFTVVADTPADTVAGDYLLTVQALSDQTESEEVDLRATAKASTSWGFIGIGLAVVAVIGLIIAFTRFKRR